MAANRGFLAILAAVWIMAYGPARAQGWSDVATDAEIFAGFCLGAAEATNARIAQDISGPAGEAAGAGFREDASRYRSYLVARGLFFGRSPVAMAGVLGSVARGRRAEQNCLAGSNSACRMIARCDSGRLPI